MSDLPITLNVQPPYHLDYGQPAWRRAIANPSGHRALQGLVRVTELGWDIETALDESTQGIGTSGYDATADDGSQFLAVGALPNLQFAQVHAELEARWADSVNFHTDLPTDPEQEWSDAYYEYLRQQAEEGPDPCDQTWDA